jgi:hypothetical protein
MKTEQELQEFYERLKNELLETTVFPTKYLYKFIIPNEDSKLVQLEEVFKGTDAKITIKDSSKAKYKGVSIEITLQNPDEVIAYYKAAGKVEGILSL